MLRDVLSRLLLACALINLGLTSPAFGEEQVKVDTGSPPPEAEKDAAVDVSGKVLGDDGKLETKLVVNCGVVTCSYYLSRGETRAVADKGVIAADAAGLIPSVGPILSKALQIANNTAKAAAKQNKCMRVRVIGLSGLPVGVYIDGGKFCRG